MESQKDIKRGVDFETRFGQTAMTISQAFVWWRGEKFNKKTLIYVLIVWVLNILLVFPIFAKNPVSSYTSSAFLLMISQFFQKFLFLKQQVFFTLLTFFSFSFAPISFYLFVRKVALRHELTAFLATLLFILPNPFFNNTPILVNGILNGDGAHIFVFSFIPLFLLYVQSFIASGAPVLYFLTAIGTAVVAIISPFAAFNLFLIYPILTIAEGFQGLLRIKIMRTVFLLLTSICLSLFWYYPSMLMKIFVMGHVQYAITKFLSVMPLTIPVIPVAGALSFLIFDRREKLKPIFISLSLFLIYLFLYGVSNQLNINGIFSADRYLPELVMAASFFLALLFILLTELMIRHLMPRMKFKRAYFAIIALVTFAGVLIIFLTIQGIGIVHAYIDSVQITENYTTGIGTIRGIIDLRDITSIIGSLISLGTFGFLLYLLRKFPFIIKKRT